MLNAEKEVVLKEEIIFGINEHIRLRRERSGVVIYWSVPTEGDNELDAGKMHYIPSATAMILALFNGERTLKEIFKAVKSIWNDPCTFDDFCKEIKKFTVKKTPPVDLSAPLLVEATGDKNQKFIHYDPESFIIEGNKFEPSKLDILCFPTNLSIIFTMNCSTDCIYCYMGRHVAPKYSHLSFSRWKELLKEIEKYQPSVISFIGGDALCYKYTLDLWEMIGDFNPPTLLDASTKTYVSEEIARRLARINGLNFQVSLDSTDFDVADAMVRRKGYGKMAIQSIKNCLSAGLPLAVKSVVTPLNIKSMPQTIVDLHNLGVYPIRAAIYNRSHWYHKDEYYNTLEEWNEFANKVKEIEAKYNFKVVIQGGGPDLKPSPKKSFEQKKKKWDERSMCTIGKRQITILPDGSLIGCEQIAQIPENLLGSVANKSLYDVWNSEDFKKKAYDIPREKYKGTPCYTCKEFKGCHSALGKGYCFRESYYLFGTNFAPSAGCPYIDKDSPRQQ